MCPLLYVRDVAGKMDHEDRAKDHIRALEERNRLRKMSLTKTREEQEREERERGFSTHFRGANAVPTDKQSSASKRATKVVTAGGGGGSGRSALSRLASILGGGGGGSCGGSEEEYVPTISARCGWGSEYLTNSSSSSSLMAERELDSHPSGDHAARKCSGSLDCGTAEEGSRSIGSLDEEVLLSSPLKGSRKTGVDGTTDGTTPTRISITELLLRKSPVKSPRPPSRDGPGKASQGDIGSVLIQHIASLDAVQQAELLKLLKVPILKVEGGSPDRRLPEKSTTTPMSEAIMVAPLPPPCISITVPDVMIVRVRIHTAWGEGCKSVSLSGIRLQLDGNVVDVLKYFKVQVLSGLQLLSNMNDAVRKVNALFTSSAGSTLVWKGPLEAGCPLEIRLQSESESNFFSTFGGKDAVASKLKIALWNAEAFGEGQHSSWSQSGVVTDTGLAAKDVDIYSGNKCIWSGELPLLEGGKLKRLGRDLVMPSIVVSAFPDGAVNCNNSHVATPPMPSAKSPKRETPGIVVHPVWLEGLKSSSSPATSDCDLDLMSTPRLSSSRPASGRRSAQAQSGLSGGGRMLASLGIEKSTISPPSQQGLEPISGRRQRRSNADKITKSPEERLEEALSKPRNDLQGDEHLRRSINAISIADRENRGRIGKSGGLGDLLQMETLEGSVDSLAKISSPGAVLISSEPSSSVGGDFASLKVKRNRRIDEVQQVVQTTLAGLAGIMSDIQQNRKSPISTTARSPIMSSSGPDELDDSSQFFQVPILPRGRVLRLEILSTWGDTYYVGLNGIDMFDSTGQKLTSRALDEGKCNNRDDAVFIESIDGNPRDINVLPEYGSDPRTVSNLIDGTSFTRDDLHVWLAPLGFYNHGGPRTAPSSDNGTPLATVTVTFSREVSLSMIRVFNYNKSRTYSFRGVRSCRILMDELLIFHGEIRIAPGLLTSADAASEVILFTTDPNVLKAVAKHDEDAGYYMDDSTEKWVGKLMDRHFERRPSTAEKLSTSGIGGGGSVQVNNKQRAALARHIRVPAAYVPSSSPSLELRSEFRPATSVARSGASSGLVVTAKDVEEEDEANFLAELRDAFPSSPPRGAAANLSPTLLRKSPILREARKEYDGQLTDRDLVTCCAVKLIIESSWGDTNYVGLAGVTVLANSTCTPLPLDPSHITAEPRDLSTLGRSDDPRKPSNLLDGVNDVADDRHMWLIPFTKGANHSIQFEWAQNEQIAGLRVWNYNKAGDDVRGVRVVTIVVYEANGQGRNLGRCVLRPAPGCDGVKFGQSILFRDVFARNKEHSFVQPAPPPKYISPPLRQDYEVPYLPTGQLWKFTFYENFSDGYYLGLDGIEMYDSSNTRLNLDEIGASVTAVPHSLQDLSSTEAANEDDPRTPDKLFFPADSCFVPGQEKHVPWLAPIARCMTRQERAAAAYRVQSLQRGGGGHELQFLPDNALFVLFPEPMSVSLVRLYNYSKTVGRGVKTLSIHVDGKLIFMGNLLPADK